MADVIDFETERQPKLRKVCKLAGMAVLEVPRKGRYEARIRRRLAADYCRPPPDAAYTMEVIGTIRPTPLSATNTTTTGAAKAIGEAVRARSPLAQERIAATPLQRPTVTRSVSTR
jgi:hypothetical protein